MFVTCQFLLEGIVGRLIVLLALVVTLWWLTAQALAQSTGPILSVCGTTLDFGSVVVDSFADLSCSVTNTGTGTLTGTASTSAPFSIVSRGSFSLEAGQSQPLILRFTPSSVGTVQGSVSLNSNGGNVTITLKGEGILGPVLAVSPTTLNFGGVRVGNSKDLLLTVRNIGVGTLTRNACVPTPFTVVPGDAFSLEAGQSQTLTVRFSPPTADQFNGTLIFSSTSCFDPQPDPVVVAVIGVGLPEQEAVGIAYVVNRASNSVSVVNTTTREVVAAIRVGITPVALALTPDGRKAYVANFDSLDISVINTATLQVTTIGSLGLNPRAIVVAPDGQRAYVANSAPGEDSVSVIDVLADKVLGNLPGLRSSPSVLALSPDGTVLYVLGTGNRFVSLVDLTTNVPFNIIAVNIEAGEDPVAVAFSPDGTKAYIANRVANTVSVFDTTTFPPTPPPKLTDVQVGRGPRSLVVSPDGTKVYVANYLDLDNPISVVSTATNQASSIIVPWEGPWDILIDPQSVGTSAPKALVINRNSGDVGILNLSTDKAEGTVEVGTNPEEGAFDPELPQAVVTNFGSNDISFFDTSGATASFSVPVGMTPVAVAVQAFVGPVAGAGPDQTVRALSRVTLDGTGSCDPQGDPLSFLWTQTEGPSVRLSDPTSLTPSFIAPFKLREGIVLSFQLVVNDGQNDSLPDTVDITVQGLRP